MAKGPGVKEQRRRERVEQKSRRTKTMVAVAVMAVAVLLAFWLFSPETVLSAKSDRAATLKDYVLNLPDLNARLEQTEPYVVFISISDAKERARVVTGIGDTLEAAWDAADKKAWARAKGLNLRQIWVKADLVNSTEEIAALDLQREIINEHFRYFYRRGLAFDQNFENAFLEAELNGNRILRYYHEDEIRDGKVDYSTPALNRNNFNNYLVETGRKKMTDIPATVTTFTTLGFICDQDGQVHELYDSGLDYGRRIVEQVDEQVVAEIVAVSSRYMVDLIGPDGKFTYGYFPIFDNPMNGYNTIRHICAAWSLLNHYYRLTGDESVLPSVDAAIQYMLDNFIEYGANGVAWVIDRDSDEVRLGGNGMAVVLLTEYMDLLKTDRYADLVRHLGDGILELQNPADGTFYHVLNAADFSRKEEFRIIYYDGEATYALARAYALTQDEKYLNGALASAENFIRNDYTKYTDHWVAYSMNEITKHVDEPRYYEFAMRNISNNLRRIYSRETSFHTYLELLMAGWDTYDRINKNEIRINYPDNFDPDYFAQTIYKRARLMLNGYFYPEYAMYMRYPDTIAGSFFVRHQDYRVRIDDVQHFVGGYYNYARYYDDILAHLSDDFLNEINAEGKGNQ